MSGIVELKTLLQSMSPVSDGIDYIFCSVDGDFSDYAHLNPIGSFVEDEGLTLILPVDAAKRAEIEYEHTYRKISLTVHSSLSATGFTAAVVNKLTSHGISANVVAAFYHDHIFVQKNTVEAALYALQQFQSKQ